ncbi:hypothetical protein F2Q69_00052063 [Brassica cretica]|uniref:F-box associated beta-propeller type 3 domain-containing protein n=1 Tax=Brassica cretica TaxID=69181 RepID=A0A8S9N0J1_BRACR|nr:hypothetical protein F2Q69_00052063 [Brassica cretica]
MPLLLSRICASHQAAIETSSSIIGSSPAICVTKRCISSQSFRIESISPKPIGCRSLGFFTLERQQSSYFPWRRVEGGISKYIPSSNGIYINGVVYYEARVKPWISSIILVTFDFGSKRFGQITTPEERFTCLANYKGKLAGLSLLGTTDAGELVFAPSSFSDDFHVFYFDIKEKAMRRVKNLHVSVVKLRI